MLRFSIGHGPCRLSALVIIYIVNLLTGVWIPTDVSHGDVIDVSRGMDYASSTPHHSGK